MKTVVFLKLPIESLQRNWVISLEAYFFGNVCC